MYSVFLVFSSLVPQSSHVIEWRKKMHNRKALAEMYLLSMTSVWSTFGYVAQGLGGL